MRLFYISAIAFVVWGCELGPGEGKVKSGTYSADLDDTYNVKVNMDNNAENVVLAIYRNASGNPICIGISNLPGLSNPRYVKVEKRGTGAWKVGDSEKSTYDRYIGDKVTLHWRHGQEGMINKKRLEYIAITTGTGGNENTYRYGYDVDGKSGYAFGSTKGEPQQTVGHNAQECGREEQAS